MSIEARQASVPVPAAAGFTVEVRVYEELNDFLPPDQRQRSFSVVSPKSRSVKDLIESLGVPHTEVDLILVDGESVGFDYLVDRAVRVTVYPVFESLDITPASMLDRPPLREVRFIADVHLGKTVRILRLLGFDCVYEPPFEDEVLARRSADEHRVLLTRDRGLLMRSVVTHGMFLHSDQPQEQVRQVVRRLDLAGAARPFARCTACNGLLRRIAKEDARDRVPARTFKYIHEYLECDGCAKVYWKGTHWERLKALTQHALDWHEGLR